MAEFQKNPDEIGVLWARTSAKGDYMTGEINGQKVVCFRASKRSDKSPDWRVLKSQPRPTQPEPEHKGTNGAYDVTDDTIPF